MTLTIQLQMFAGLAAATLCLGTVASTEATAQIFRQRVTTYGYYNPYGGGYSTGYYGGPGYGYSGYNGYGQGRYGYGSTSGYGYPSSGAYGYGTYYRGGLFPQSQTFGPAYYGQGSRYYNPYGYGSGY